jgi:hypothetical protein
MRPARLVIAAVSMAALVTPGLSPAAQAAGSVSYTVHDAQRAEYTLDCTDEPPSDCNVQRPNTMYVGITVNNRPKPYKNITVNYQIVNGTAVSGQDFTGTTGTVTITPYNQNINVEIPLINDGVAEPSETFTVRITSVSTPGNISDTGTATITDGNQFPPDCTLSQDLDQELRSLTCTNRPAGEQWYIVQPWASIGGIDWDYGNVVTGNGTSTAGWAAYPQAPYRGCIGSTGAC